MRQLPIGIIALVGLFILGACASGASLAALLLPESAFKHIWRLNPEAEQALVSLGPAAAALMLTVCVACCLAAIGLLRKIWWGHRLAIGILVVNLIGDTANAVLRNDLRTLVGLPIGAALVVYLLRPTVVQLYKRSAHA